MISYSEHSKIIPQVKAKIKFLKVTPGVEMSKYLGNTLIESMM